MTYWKAVKIPQFVKVPESKLLSARGYVTSCDVRINMTTLDKLQMFTPRQEYHIMRQCSP
jgi:hypothetical protein